MAITKDDRETRAQLAAQLARLYPDVSHWQIARDVDALGRLGRRAHRHAERMCSDEGYYNANTDENGVDVKDARAEARAAQIAARYPGMKIRLEGDPRGYVLYVTAPGLLGNTWGGDEHGFGVN